MRKIILVAIVCGGLMISCSHKSGSGNIVSSDKTVGPFTALKVSGGFEVKIKTNGPDKITLEADDNLIKYIEMKVVSGELRIRLDEMNVSNANLKVFITTSTLRNIDASAGAEVDVVGELTSDKTIGLEASSGSSIQATLDAPEVKANVSSGGKMTLAGHTKDLHATSSSGASIEAEKLLSENSFVNASSSGSADVYASVSVDANASSGGSIKYSGPATNIKKTASSGGDVEKEN